MKRRNLLLAGLSGIAFAGCAATNLTPAAVVADAATIVNGLAATLAQIQKAAPGLIGPAAAAQVAGYIRQAQAALAGLSGNLPAQQGATVLRQIEDWINAALDTLAAVPAIPVPFSSYIAAAAALLPILEGFVNATLGTVASAARLRANRVAMTADQARALLVHAAGQ